MEIDLDDGPPLVHEGTMEFEAFMRSEYPIDDKTGKPYMTVFSNVIQLVEPHMKCINNLGGIDNLVEPVQDLLKVICLDECVRSSNFLDLEDVEEIRPQPVRFLVDEFKNILNDDHIPINIREKQSEISKAYIAPFVGFINKELVNRATPHSAKRRVLIMGAGEGKDIRRLLSSLHYGLEIVAVEPDDRASQVLEATYANVLLLKCTMKDALFDLYSMPKFDIIIANMSFHYCMGVESAPMIAKFIDERLNLGGICFGSYIDVPSVKYSGMIQCLKNGHSVTYLGESKRELYGEKPVFGVATISVAGRLWEDPYFDISYLYDLLAGRSFSFNVYTGHDMLIGPQDVNPHVHVKGFANALKRPELSMYRCVIITKNLAPYNIPYSPPVSLVDTRETGLVERAMVVPFNKGLPLEPWETQFVNVEGCWIADKKNGIAAKLVYVDGAIMVLVKGRSLTVPGFQNQAQLSFVLQVELIETASKAQLVDGDLNYWIVVTDVLVAPWGRTGSFISRWRWLEDLYVNRKPQWKSNKLVTQMEWPFVLQRWYALNDPESVQMLFEAKEGVVVQSLVAPPSAIRGNAGSAHYVKRVWTIDVKGPAGIEERRLVDNTFVRNRPDKDKPNPPNVIEKIARAVRYDEFIVFVLARVVGAMDASHKRVMQHVLRGRHMSQWAPADLVWAYVNKDNPVLSMVAPDIVKYLNITFPEFCSNLGMGTEEKMVRMPELVLDKEYVYLDANGDKQRVVIKGNSDKIREMFSRDKVGDMKPIVIGSMRFEMMPDATWTDELHTLINRHRLMEI